MTLSEESPIFVVGAPRSGTTWLQRLISSHPSVASPQETFLIAHYLGPQVRAWRREMARIHEQVGLGAEQFDRLVGLPSVLTEREFRASLLCLYESARDNALAAKPGSRIFLEKTPLHAMWLEELQWLLPSARVIHIVRQPVDVVTSMLTVPWKADGRDRAYAELAAKRWNESVIAARAAAATLEGRYLEVSYELLADEPVGGLAKVFDFLGLVASPAMVESFVDQASSHVSARELVTAGELARLRSEITEPRGFDRRTRGAPTPLTAFERWLVESATETGPHERLPTWKLGIYRTRRLARRAARVVRNLRQ